MRKGFWGVLVVVAVLSSLCLCECGYEGELNPTLAIEGGMVKGVVSEDGNTLIYRGIPYAAAPVGELRWKLPQAVEPWEGVLLAGEFRNAAPQAAHGPDDGGYGTEFFPTDAPFSEDCLYLNVWTPREAAGHPETKLPVAMWIHGGAYTGGWGFEPEMDGEAWARKGVILVTINYRLGVFGYLTHPLLSEENGGRSGNYGTYDQAAALHWIHHNIAAFGGDPEHITVVGQSAGAASVKNMVISPLTRNLVSGAIIQSIGGIGINLANQEPQEALDAKAKVRYDAAGFPTLEALRAATYDELSAAAGNAWADPSAVTFRPHADGHLLVESFDEACYNGGIADIPYMIGSVANDLPGLEGGIRQFAELRSESSEQPTYVYFFDRALPSDGRPSLAGAFHSSELWYEFGTLSRSWRPFTEEDYALSERMVAYWTNFCKYGNPNGKGEQEWKPYARQAAFVMRLATGTAPDEGDGVILGE